MAGRPGVSRTTGHRADGAAREGLSRGEEWGRVGGMREGLAVGTGIFLALAACVSAGGGNLLPNGAFEGRDPLAGWLTSFPDEAWYRDNGKYLKVAPVAAPGGRKAVMFDLAAGIAGNQGGKIESVPVPVVAGGRYKVEVDCMTWDFGAKIHAEVWTEDPNPGQKRTIFRRAAAGGRPALIMCYRAQVPDPPGGAREWSTTGREFTVPATVKVSGREQAPEFITVKAVVYAATMSAGKSYFANFRLTRVDGGEGSGGNKP